MQKGQQSLLHSSWQGPLDFTMRFRLGGLTSSFGLTQDFQEQPPVPTPTTAGLGMDDMDAPMPDLDLQCAALSLVADEPCTCRPQYFQYSLLMWQLWHFASLHASCPWKTCDSACCWP